MNVKSRELVESAILRLGLYDPVRNGYLRLLNRAHWRVLLEEKRRLAEFIRPGDTVFDIGANRGEVTHLMLRLGARPIAVEPNPVLAARLQSRFRGVPVVEAAAGPHDGYASLYVGVDLGHSTISPQWVDVSETGRWLGEELKVEMITLDSLIARYGLPTFAKIDVEGFEDRVLEGLSTPIRLVQFEVIAQLFDVFESAVERLARLGAYEFRLATGSGSDAWLEPLAMRALVQRRFEAGESGDVLARLSVT